MRARAARFPDAERYGEREECHQAVHPEHCPEAEPVRHQPAQHGTDCSAHRVHAHEAAHHAATLLGAHHVDRRDLAGNLPGGRAQAGQELRDQQQRKSRRDGSEA